MTGESSNYTGKVQLQEVTKQSPPDHKSDQEESEDKESSSEVNCNVLHFYQVSHLSQ